MIIEDFLMIIPKEMKWKDRVFVKSSERKHEHVHAWINNLGRMHSLVMSKCYIFKDRKPVNYICFAAAATVSMNGNRKNEGIIPYLLNEIYDAFDVTRDFCSRCSPLFQWIGYLIEILGRFLRYKHYKAYATFDDARQEGKLFQDYTSMALSKFEKKHGKEYKVMEFTTENKQQGQYGIKR